MPTAATEAREQGVYSQNREQQAILAAVGAKPGKFLDIGAFDGKSFSNTLALVERGWSGVLVEPGIESFKALVSLHGGNPKLSLVQAVIGCERGIVKFWDCGDLYSTTETGHVAKWDKYLRTQGKPFANPYWLPQISTLDLVSKFPGPYDVVSIDTEGTSIPLFYNFMKFAEPPKVIVVEHDGQENACMSVVGARYDCVESNAENLVLVRREREIR